MQGQGLGEEVGLGRPPPVDGRPAHARPRAPPRRGRSRPCPRRAARGTPRPRAGARPRCGRPPGPARGSDGAGSVGATGGSNRDITSTLGPCPPTGRSRTGTTRSCPATTSRPAAAARRQRRRRGHRRRRVHRALDGDSLLRADPSLRVVVLERDTAGFGASGRNGGWCVGDYGGPLGARRAGTAGRGAVERDGPGDAPQRRRGRRRGRPRPASTAGSTRAAPSTSPSNDGQLRRVRQLPRGPRQATASATPGTCSTPSRRPRSSTCPASAARSFTPARRRRAPGAPGPGHRRRGRAARRQRSTRAPPCGRSRTGEVRTDRGTVRADVVVRATEAYTGTHRGPRARDRCPLGNYMIATEPIDDATWADDRPGQPRAVRAERRDARLRPAHRRRAHRLGRSRRRCRSGAAASRRRRCATTAHRAPACERRSSRLFPALDGIGFTHHWGGVLGVPRDLLPGIGFDRATGFAWAGGYNGQGVAVGQRRRARASPT